MQAIITGTGSVIPSKRVPNSAFLAHDFLDKNGEAVNKPSSAIVQKLEQISGIRERKYIGDHRDTAELGAVACNRAISDAGLVNSDIDGLLVAHNFGNIKPGMAQGHLVPNLAAVIKKHVQLSNPKCFALDVLFGCPGWVEAMIMADHYIKSGRCKNLLVLGVEVISRILDPKDMNSMLFGDGAGAVVLSAVDQKDSGIIAYNTYSHCQEETDYIFMGESSQSTSSCFLSPKMAGPKVFKYGLTHIPELIKECLSENSLELDQINKFLFHQANEKMIMAIAKKLFDEKLDVDHIRTKVPFMVQEIGNSSVATIPTMLDFILRGKLAPHEIKANDTVVMCSVGAGMHCNCLIYTA
ncbi:MAG: 3-oxoacyl-ACP synthase III family protein [Bacteroidota bacterium]